MPCLQLVQLVSIMLHVSQGGLQGLQIFWGPSKDPGGQASWQYFPSDVVVMTPLQISTHFPL